MRENCVLWVRLHLPPHHFVVDLQVEAAVLRLPVERERGLCLSGVDEVQAEVWLPARKPSGSALLDGRSKVLLDFLLDVVGESSGDRVEASSIDLVDWNVEIRNGLRPQLQHLHLLSQICFREFLLKDCQVVVVEAEELVLKMENFAHRLQAEDQVVLSASQVQLDELGVLNSHPEVSANSQGFPFKLAERLGLPGAVLLQAELLAEMVVVGDELENIIEVHHDLPWFPPDWKFADEDIKLHFSFVVLIN